MAKVVVTARELAAFHEAGHVEAALGCGAHVTSVAVYQEPVHGRTEIVTRGGEDLRRIRAAGYAAEFQLWRAGRLVMEDGLSEEEFTRRALNRASRDFAQFSNESDFIECAIDHAEHSQRFELVEKIAGALLAAGKLDEAALARIAGGSSAVPDDLSELKLAAISLVATLAIGIMWRGWPHSAAEWFGVWAWGSVGTSALMVAGAALWAGCHAVVLNYRIKFEQKGGG